MLKTKTIKIGGKDYPVVLSLMAMMEFEELSGHSISDFTDKIKDRVLFFYCAFKAGGSLLTYDEFVNLINLEPEAIGEFVNLFLVSGEKKAKAR